MGNRVDLNARRNTNNNTHRNRHSNYHSNSDQTPNNEETSNNSPSNLEKKATEAGLRAVGVPKEIANKIASNEKTYELAKKGTFTVKFPLPVKIAMTALMVGIPFVALMLFVVLFGGSASAASAGNFVYGQTCPTIIVENTGCNIDGEECSNIYDGSVDLENYVAGVVAAEIGNANNLEYYKVAAIAARTYVLKNIGNDCTVEGNTKFQAYMDIENSNHADLIKQAVEDTEGLVLVKNNDLADTYYASACVVNADDEYYYVRYGTESLGEANFQKIPKEWDETSSVFKGYLEIWYSMIDKNNTDYENKKCPKNHDYGMSQIGALYLITGENYDYKEVIKYYYGEDTEIMKNTMQLSGVDGFINPTRYINCTSPFGERIHPVNSAISNHTGLDIAIPGGEPIYAVKDGTIRQVINYVTAINNCDYSYGNYVLIDHLDGTSSLYAHIKYGTIPDEIYEGAEISQGEQIGEVGSTGCSTGNHLHYEVRLNNINVDPADYIDLTNATGTCRR